MARVSFMQTSFLSGEWSLTAQGRIDSSSYKLGMKRCLNYIPVEEGPVMRRPGFRRLAYTRAGQAARLVAFDFSFSQSYQIELTNGMLRLFSGLDRVFAATTANITSISTASPAVVGLSANMTATWANGDYIYLAFNQVPCTAPELCGREFLIDNLDANSCDIYDPITGDPIDGAALAYVADAAVPDVASKIFEIVTPYVSGQWADVQAVQDETSVLLLHGDYQPRLLAQAAGVFAIATQDFLDGPYLDINATATTLTSSGSSGSVTITASAVTGINDNTGFQTTDVGRLIRFQADPGAWSAATTYSKGQVVTGSDGNVYRSLQGGNINHNPTTDTEVYWTLLPASESTLAPVWTWLKITARASTTSVTATIMGEALTSLVTTVWRLGLYSDTTAWPTCGLYYDGRLWLGGAVVNRFDASKSTEPFDFAPTATDGTVADDNAISATVKAKDRNAFFWFLGLEDGILAGTQAGEWLIQAADTGVIAPASIKARRVTTYGSANIPAIQAAGASLFVQRQQGKVLDIADYPYGETSGWFAKDISENSHHLTQEVEEIAWQQEPDSIVWARTAAGTLLGSTFSHAPYGEDSFAAWHPHAHGAGRTITSISAGPSYDGLSNSLYVVTNQTGASKPDFGVRAVEVMMPAFDETAPVYSAWHVDGAVVPCCVRVMSIANGDTYDGIRFYGLDHVNGQTVQVQVGGFDLGDFVVASAQIDVPYTSDFTLAYLDTLNGQDYGVYAIQAYYAVTTAAFFPPVAANSLLAMTTDTTPIWDDYGLLDAGADVFYTAKGVSLEGIRTYDGDDGSNLLGKDNDTIFGDNTHLYEPIFLHAGGFIFSPQHLSKASAVVSKIQAATLAFVSEFGTDSNDRSQSSGTRLVRADFMCGPQILDSGGAAIHNYLVSTAYRAAGSGGSGKSEVAVLDADNFTNAALPLFYAVDIDETLARCCSAPMQSGLARFFVLGCYIEDTSNANVLGIYSYTIQHQDAPASPIVTRVKAGTLSPAQVDATWTNFTVVRGPMYDKEDGNLIIYASTSDAVATKNYLVKINATTAAVMWKLAVPTTNYYDQLWQVQCRGTYAFLHHTTSPLATTVYIVDTSAGTQSTQTWNRGLVPTGTATATTNRNQIYDQVTSSILFYGDYAFNASDAAPTYLGAWLAANGNAFTSRWARIFLGLQQPAVTDVTTYDFYGAIGFTYTSEGQLLRPDYGQDAGAVAGPAFGKTRRIHKFAALLTRTQGIEFGCDSFAYDSNLALKDDSGTVPALPPTLFSGIIRGSTRSDYNFDGCLKWRQTRPWPGLINSIGGFIETQEP